MKEAAPGGWRNITKKKAAVWWHQRVIGSMQLGICYQTYKCLFLIYLKSSCSITFPHLKTEWSAKKGSCSSVKLLSPFSNKYQEITFWSKFSSFDLKPKCFAVPILLCIGFRKSDIANKWLLVNDARVSWINLTPSKCTETSDWESLESSLVLL